MKQHFLHITIPLTIGAAIYLLFRNLPFFSFVDLASPLLNPEMVPGWVRFHLPDFLWAYSFSFIFLAIWRDNKSLNFWIASAFVVSIILETAQLSHHFPGTFDWIDLAAYTLGFLTSIFIDKKILNPHSKTQTSTPL